MIIPGETLSWSVCACTTLQQLRRARYGNIWARRPPGSATTDHISAEATVVRHHLAENHPQARLIFDHDDGVLTLRAIAVVRNASQLSLSDGGWKPCKGILKHMTAKPHRKQRERASTAVMGDTGPARPMSEEGL
jgi:hypothetical protein